MDEIVVPLRRAPSGSPTYSTGNQSAHWDSACPVGTLQTAPSTRDVPKISPLVAHRVHSEPLSGLVFTQKSVLTVCREGHIKIWMRPGFSENQSNSSDSALSTSLKEKSLLMFQEVPFLHDVLVVPSFSSGCFARKWQSLHSMRAWRLKMVPLYIKG